MATPDFILALREKIGTMPLWLAGVTAVVTKGEDVLLVRRSDNGQWTPVTGIIDPGEQPADAAAREVLEEAGVRAVPERLAGIGVTDTIVYPNGDTSQYLDVIFTCRFVDGDPWPADGENTEAAWFSRHALPEMSEDMQRRIATALSSTPSAAFQFTAS